MKQQAKGFTLIETMIAVAIVGILAAIAYPSYSDSVRKGRRAEAINTLSAIALAQEKWRANNAAYGFVSACAVAAPGCWRILGTAAAGTATTEGGYYNLANAAASTGTTFSISATAPTGSNQAADKANGVSCTALTINQSGPVITTQAACWNRR